MIELNDRDSLVSFLESSEKSSEIEFKGINDLKEFLELSGFEMEELDDNTNGWQLDFWYHFKHPKYGRYCLSGSLWYGNFTLSKEE